MRHGIHVVICAMVVFAFVSSARAQSTPDPCGYGDSFGNFCMSGQIWKVQHGGTSFATASNFWVKICPADSNGNYNMAACSVGVATTDGWWRVFDPIQNSSYRIYAWDPYGYWGSQYGEFITVHTPYCSIGGCRIHAQAMYSYPSPLPPQALSPLDNGSVGPDPCTTTVQWSTGLDWEREGWLTTYDLYGGGNDYSQLVYSNVSTTSGTFQLPASIPWNWTVVAKIQTPSGVIHSTQSNTFHFVTTNPGDPCH